MLTITGILLILITLAYPALVYYGYVAHVEPRLLAFLLAGVLFLRLSLMRNGRRWLIPLFVVGLLFFLFAIWRNDIFTLRLYPLLINVVMLILFAWSLVSPPSIIERIARLQHPHLSPSGVRYTRKVTQVWCVFFFLNGSMAAATTYWADVKIWSLYNGLIAYVLMGLLFCGEYMIRIRVLKYHA